MEDSNANQATSPSPMTLRPSPTAGRSGGPRSAEGKRRSCQNARRHGIYTDERFLEGAAQFRALLIWKVAVLAAFKKIKNRGNELKDLLQRQGITEIATSIRTHTCAEKVRIEAKKSTISGARRAVVRAGRACVPRHSQDKLSHNRPFRRWAVRASLVAARGRAQMSSR